jgi:hypothetical protein
MAELITDIEQVTPAWLTTTLRQASVLRAGSVTAVTVANHLATPSAERYTLQLKYSGLKAGASKLETATTPIPPRRLYLFFGQGNEREVVFYNATREANAAKRLPVIPCYASVYAPEQDRFHILMKDLTETHGPVAPPPLPPLRPQAEVILSWLARLHAAFWEHTQLGNGIGSIPVHLRGLAPYREQVNRIKKQYQAMASFLDDRLTPDQQRMYEQALAFLPSLGEEYWRPRINEMLGLTLINGDMGINRILYPRDDIGDRVYFTGWQSHRVGVCATDIAALISYNWYADAERALPLIRHYHNALLDCGVQNYDWDVFWVDYRLAVINLMFEPARLFANGCDAVTWWPLLQKALPAYQALDCAALVTAG